MPKPHHYSPNQIFVVSHNGKPITSFATLADAHVFLKLKANQIENCRLRLLSEIVYDLENHAGFAFASTDLWALSISSINFHPCLTF